MHLKPRPHEPEYFFKVHTFCTQNQCASSLAKPGSPVTETALFSKFLPRDLRSRRVHTNPDEKNTRFQNVQIGVDMA